MHIKPCMLSRTFNLPTYTLQHIVWCPKFLCLYHRIGSLSIINHPLHPTAKTERPSSSSSLRPILHVALHTIPCSIVHYYFVNPLWSPRSPGMMVHRRKKAHKNRLFSESLIHHVASACSWPQRLL